MEKTTRSAVQAELSQPQVQSSFSELVVGEVGAVSYDGHSVAHSIWRQWVVHFSRQFESFPPGGEVGACCVRRAYAVALILSVLLYLMRSITGVRGFFFCIPASRVLIRCFTAFRLERARLQLARARLQLARE